MKHIQKAFTLIELMIIIAIIGILAAILVPSCSSSDPSRYKLGQECEILGDPVVITDVHPWNQYTVLFKSGEDEVVKEEILKNCKRSS